MMRNFPLNNAKYLIEEAYSGIKNRPDQNILPFFNFGKKFIHHIEG